MKRRYGFRNFYGIALGWYTYSIRFPLRRGLVSFIMVLFISSVRSGALENNLASMSVGFFSFMRT